MPKRHDMLEVNEAQNGSELEMRIGEPLQLRLQENPTTGYRWQVESSGGPVLELAEQFFEPAREGYGAGGVRRWVFRSAQEGVALLEMARRRSWERQAIETFKVTVRVKSGSR
jgi:inhibitor of cysteine peptidase